MPVRTLATVMRLWFAVFVIIGGVAALGFGTIARSKNNEARATPTGAATFVIGAGRLGGLRVTVGPLMKRLGYRRSRQTFDEVE